MTGYLNKNKKIKLSITEKQIKNMKKGWKPVWLYHSNKKELYITLELSGVEER